MCFLGVSVGHSGASKFARYSTCCLSTAGSLPRPKAGEPLGLLASLPISHPPLCLHPAAAYTGP